MLEYNKKYKYKDLCKSLGLEILSDGYKKNQIEQLKKEYQMVIRNGWYIVKRKYEDYEMIENNAYFKNKSYLEPILYTLLSQADSNVLQFDMKELLQITAVVNQDYHFAKWHIEEVDAELTNDNSGLKIFIEETEPMYKRIIKDVLKDMESRQLIQIEEIPMYGKIYRDDKGNRYTQIIEADDSVGKPTFLEAKRQAMQHFNIEHWEDMRTLNYYEWHEAKKIIEDYLKEKLGVSYFYYEYKLILNKVGIEEMVTNNFNEMRQSFNNYIKSKTLSSKNKNLKLISDDNRLIYTNALLDINTDLHLRNKFRKENDENEIK